MPSLTPSRDKDRERHSTTTTKAKSHHKDRDRERDRDSDRHSRSSHGKKSGSSTKDRDRDATGERRRSTASTSSTTTTSSARRERRSSMPGVESASRPSTASFLESRTSLPYPTFSKAHSKEAVGNRDSLGAKLSVLTPDPTDLAAGKDAGGQADSNAGKSSSSGKHSDGVNGGAKNTQHKSHDHNHNNHHHHHHNAPPSPPLTSVDQQSQRRGSRSTDEREGEEKVKDGKEKIKIRSGSTRSSPSLRVKKEDSPRSHRSSRHEGMSLRAKLHSEVDAVRRATSHRTPSKTKLHDRVELPRRSHSHRAASPTHSPVTIPEEASEANDSDATSIAPNQPSTCQTPASPPKKPPSRNQTRSSMSHHQTPVEAVVDADNTAGRYGTPPPPPPPPQMPLSIPKVDYLLQNGGLNYRVPKNMLCAGEPPNPQQQPFQPQVASFKVFEPFNRLLDDYSTVMAKNGSLAVATGYRSVARRLLDRLEAVFARDISSESCQCLMCDKDNWTERASGVSWGEVLELVSGRKELPSWPPFMISPAVVNQESAGEEHIPMQKLDIDVPEEYREHYIRQSRKTKQAVDKWLLGQTEQSTPPDEVDDETLTFAIMTHLDNEQRQLFRSLLGIASTPAPVERTETPLSRARSAPLTASGLAIQRLYRLPLPPRDPETAIYMLNNPGMHNVLATLAAISNDEWEILISGRFDGFLRSGADDNLPPPMSASVPPRTASRAGTPFSAAGPTPSYMDGTFRPVSQPYGSNMSINSSTTPASFGAPIAMDEETEIAALAEIERDIYLSMEALEDAFEALHCKAEAVRRLLRERGAGLSLANQARRGSTAVEARLGTPAPALGGNGTAWEESGTEDDGIDDNMSLAPDDSASNISSNRRRRPKRRTERRTPAPVEEEDEEAHHHHHHHHHESKRDGGSRRR